MCVKIDVHGVGFAGKCIGGEHGVRCGLWVLRGGNTICGGEGFSVVYSGIRGVDETGSFDGHLGVVEIDGIGLCFVVHFGLMVLGGIGSSVVIDFGVVEVGRLEISVVAVVGTSSVCVVVVCLSSVIGESVGVVVSAGLTVDAVTLGLSDGLVVLQKLVLFRLFNKKPHNQ